MAKKQEPCEKWQEESPSARRTAVEKSALTADFSRRRNEACCLDAPVKPEHDGQLSRNWPGNDEREEVVLHPQLLSVDEKRVLPPA